MNVQCDVVHEVWGPNEGCKEFMDVPEGFRCSNPAAHVMAFESRNPAFPGVNVVYFCEPCYQHEDLHPDPHEKVVARW